MGEILTRLQNVANDLNKCVENSSEGDEGLELLQSNINLQRLIFYLKKWKGDELVKRYGADERLIPFGGKENESKRPDDSLLNDSDLKILFDEELPENIRRVIDIVHNSLKIDEKLKSALLNVTIPKADGNKSRPVSAFGSVSKPTSAPAPAAATTPKAAGSKVMLKSAVKPQAKNIAQSPISRSGAETETDSRGDKATSKVAAKASVKGVPKSASKTTAKAKSGATLASAPNVIEEEVKKK